MSNKINVLDAICGKGKTEAMINYINNTNKKILYITPFLSEVERIKLSCPDKKFKSPERRGSKMYDIKRLLQKGENIVSTHALFKMFDEETIDITMLNDYTLIMDEVAEVVEVVGISKYDLDTLLEKYVEIEDNGMIRWISTDYEEWNLFFYGCSPHLYLGLFQKCLSLHTCLILKFKNIIMIILGLNM